MSQEYRSENPNPAPTPAKSASVGRGFNWPHYPVNPPSSNIFAKWFKLLTHPSITVYAEEGSDAELFTPALNGIIYAAVIIIYGLTGTVLNRFSLDFLLIGLCLIAPVSALIAVAAMFTGSGFIYLPVKL